MRLNRFTETLRKLCKRSPSLHAARGQQLAMRAWDLIYGARPLKRTIQRLLQDPLAMMLLEGKFSEDDTIEVDVKDDELTFARAKLAASVA